MNTLETPEQFEADYLGKDGLRETGWDGTEEGWEFARRIIVNAIDHNGVLLDLGCANGRLAEDLQKWAKEKGLELEVYGVDFVPKLIEKARQRFPNHADNFTVADVNTFVPPRPVTYIRSELGYFSGGQEELALQLKRYLDYIVPGGKLILTLYQGENPEDATLFKQEIQGLNLGHVEFFENYDTCVCAIHKQPRLS